MVEKDLNACFGGISDNPSVSFADSSLYTREPVLKHLGTVNRTQMLE